MGVVRTGCTPIALASLFLVALGVGPVTAQTEVVEYYGQDALGSIRIVFDVNGVATARADFEPFGELFTVPGMPGGQLPAQQFTGQERDPEASQDYFGARFYTPRTGRFSQGDPVYAGLFDPQQWNRYAYVGNNPLSFVDPDGRMRVDCVQQDLNWAQCLKLTAPDSSFGDLFGWQQFLRQGRINGGGHGGGRPGGGDGDGEGDGNGAGDNNGDGSDDGDGNGGDGGGDGGGHGDGNVGDDDGCSGGGGKVYYASVGGFFTPLLGVEGSVGLAINPATGYVAVTLTRSAAPTVGIGWGGAFTLGSSKNLGTLLGRSWHLQGGAGPVSGEAFKDNANRFTGAGLGPSFTRLSATYGAAVGRVITTAKVLRAGSCN